MSRFLVWISSSIPTKPSISPVCVCELLPDFFGKNEKLTCPLAALHKSLHSIYKPNTHSNTLHGIHKSWPRGVIGMRHAFCFCEMSWRELERKSWDWIMPSFIFYHLIPREDISNTFMRTRRTLDWSVEYWIITGHSEEQNRPTAALVGFLVFFWDPAKSRRWRCCSMVSAERIIWPAHQIFDEPNATSTLIFEHRRSAEPIGLFSLMHHLLKLCIIQNSWMVWARMTEGSFRRPLTIA